MTELKSPYKHLGETRKILQCRVSHDDWQYIIRKFPYGVTGIQDVILSTLFSKFVTEIKKHEPFDSGALVNDLGFTILTNVLSSVFMDGRSTRSNPPTEEARPRDVGPGTNPIREESSGTPVQLPSETSGDKPRRKATKGKGGKKIERPTS